MRLQGWVRYADGEERPDVAITWGKLKELLEDIDDQTMIRVHPITRNLSLDNYAYVDIAEEQIERFFR